jgi:hypothetical protein
MIRYRYAGKGWWARILDKNVRRGVGVMVGDAEPIPRPTIDDILARHADRAAYLIFK